MRTLRPKTSRSRIKPQKRGTPLWWLGAHLRQIWSNIFIRTAIVGGGSVLFMALLWFAEYPQRVGNFVSSSLIAATGKMGFRLCDVLVEGRHNAPVEKILNAVHLKRGDPLLAYDPYQIKKQLEEISWIQKATVKRQLPGIIFIQLTERQPVALWQHQQRHYLVDEQGVIISSDHLQPFEKLPLIVGGDAPVHAPPVLRLLEKFPDIRQKLTALVRVGGRRWDLHLDKTLQIKLPETNVEEALRRLSLLMEQKKINFGEVAVLDLRVTNQMVMRLSPTASVRLKGKGKET